MDSRIRSARNALFLELKPICVELSQLALRDNGSKDNTKLLTQSTSELLEILEQQCRRTDGVFDQKLADYVFFPLSQILRKKKQKTDRLLELTLKCLSILLEYGWRTIELDLGKQLLILLTFVAGGVPGKEPAPAPEEVQIAAYGGLASLFRNLALTPGSGSSLIDSGTLPALGHCVTVILDGVTDGASAEVQTQALNALGATWRCIKDAEALASFLPGTISGLTKCLMPTTAARRTKKTVITALDVLQNVLISVLGDLQTRNIRSQDKPASEASSGSSERALTPSWLKATTGQIKLALSNVVRLRKHESLDVKSALNKLCLTLLDECHETLNDSAAMLVETSMTLDGETQEDGLNTSRTTLADLATIYPDITEHVKSTVYNWVTSLPRVMQANDESAKITALDQLAKAHSLFSGLGIESSVLDDSLATSLRDSITLTLEASPSSKFVEETALNLNSQAAMTLLTESVHAVSLRPIIMPEQSQQRILQQFQNLVANLGTRDSRISLASDMLDHVRGADGPSILSAFWLSTNILQSVAEENQELDEFFESSLTLSDEQASVSEELFSYSLSVLIEPEERQDWRVQAVALEVMAHTAQQRKHGFRADLIDVLYPTTQLLGSSQSRLREHAITCLNIIAKACGYTNASEMIVENADYMVNAVSLRLNTFDISASAPQVLVMMIRLTGPSLLHYLDDVVESIFAALDNFHGYPLLVESLFSVLGEIVSVGSKSDQLTIENTPPISRLEPLPTPPSIDDILSLIISKHPPSKPANIYDHDDFPRAPWKSAKTLLDEANPKPTNDDYDTPPEEFEPSQEIIIPPTKTHTLLHLITQQTQNHLTTSSPTLRTNLLTLIQTSILSLPSTSPDFLPLINDIWPVVFQRLYDPEPYVQIAAADTISALCRATGDFLNTRFRTEWAMLTRFVRGLKGAVEREKRGKGGRGAYSMVRKVWEAVVGLLGDVVGWVGVGDGMFDDVLDVVGWEELVGRRKVTELLAGGRGNRDAVWLELEMAGKGERERREWVVPRLEGHIFSEMPAGRAEVVS